MENMPDGKEGLSAKIARQRKADLDCYAVLRVQMHGEADEATTLAPDVSRRCSSQGQGGGRIPGRVGKQLGALLRKLACSKLGRGAAAVGAPPAVMDLLSEVGAAVVHGCFALKGMAAQALNTCSGDHWRSHSSEPLRQPDAKTFAELRACSPRGFALW